MNFKIFARKFSGQFEPESGGQFNRYLHFAVKDLDNLELDGSFYIAQTKSSLTGGIDFTSESDVDSYNFCSLIPSKFDDRIITQNSIFTTHTLPKGLDSFISPEIDENCKDKRLFKYRIPYRFKAKIKLELEMVGINHARLFPGLDGIGQNINWMFSRNKHWNKLIHDWHIDS